MMSKHDPVFGGGGGVAGKQITLMINAPSHHSCTVATSTTTVYREEFQLTSRQKWSHDVQLAVCHKGSIDTQHIGVFT